MSVDFFVSFSIDSAGKVDFVKEILRRRDVDPNQPHQMLKKNPLHVAGMC